MDTADPSVLSQPPTRTPPSRRRLNHQPLDRLAWIDGGLPFNAFGKALRRRYGGRIQRVSIDAGFSCPNVDGSVTTGGCNFCDNRSFSPSRRVRLKRVAEQLSSGIRTVSKRYNRVAGFIAYFQPATNTYAPIDQLEEIYRLALSADPRIVGLAIGTRPDCVPNSVLDLLESLATEFDVSLELGMQSIHDQTLAWMNRAHRHDDMINAVERARRRGFETCAHVILGCPDESHRDMMSTADEVARLGIDAIKLHNLYCVRGTPLADDVLSGRIQMMEREPYIKTVVDFLQRIPPQVIVERISGDAPPDFLIAPKWCAEKSAIRIEIEAEFDRRGARQGDQFQPPSIPPDQRPRPNDRTPSSILAKIDSQRRLPVLRLQ
ncbi:MAG: TIGR01212 family radical SAM protein [Planctomycetota bacterium]